MRLVWNPIKSQISDEEKQKKALKGKAQNPEAAESDSEPEDHASQRQLNRISERRFEQILDELKKHSQTVIRFKGTGPSREDAFKTHKFKLTARQKIALDLLKKIEPFDS
jgi:hypothetical protein